LIILLFYTQGEVTSQ